MSIPPASQPPGGYPLPSYSGPPASSNSGGCWKAFGITCGVLILIGIISLAMLGRWFGNEMSHPTKGSIFAGIMKSVTATQEGVQIQRAIVSYHTAHGKYPQTLLDLVSDGLIDGKLLHSELDADSADPGHISWKYHKPAEGAPPTTPLLDLHCRLDLNLHSRQGTAPADGHIVISLGGKPMSQFGPVNPGNSGNGFPPGGHP